MESNALHRVLFFVYSSTSSGIYYDYGRRIDLMRHESELIEFLKGKGDSRTDHRIILGTHSGEFHADELLATAVLTTELRKFAGANRYRYDIRVYRSRDLNYLNNACDLVYDIGNGKYDHHSADQVYYPNGIPMASCGKILNDVILDADIAEGLRRKLFYAVEANDNGAPLPDYLESSQLAFVGAFNQRWDEEWTGRQTRDHFNNVLNIVEVIYERIYKSVLSDIAAKAQLEKFSTFMHDGKFLILDRYCPYHEYARTHPELIAVVYPKDHQWMIRMSPTFKRKYETRYLFPREWAGLSDSALRDISGVPSIRFCHRALFLTTCNTKEGALEVCKIVLKKLNESGGLQK